MSRSLRLPTLALACTLLCTTALAQQKGTFTDTRDGKTYKTVKIAEQIWMAENLNYNASGSKCYKDSTTYCEKYGKLYNWEMAKMACPKVLQAANFLSKVLKLSLNLSLSTSTLGGILAKFSPGKGVVLATSKQ